MPCQLLCLPSCILQGYIGSVVKMTSNFQGTIQISYIGSETYDVGMNAL